MKRQLNGLIITNGYIQVKKFNEITQMYIDAGAKEGVALKHMTTAEVVYGIAGDRYMHTLKGQVDFVLFLDKDIRLARVFEANHIRVFNTAKVIEICDDKAKTFEYLTGHQIAMPKTLISPLVFPGTYSHGIEDPYIEQIISHLTFPIVVKACSGSFGQEVFLANDQEELIKLRQKLIDIPHIYQQYITSSKGRDVRVHVVGEEVVASILRTSTTDFRANLTQGGYAKKYELPSAFKEMALKVAKVLKADFLGIDIMFDKDDQPILCEVNSNAHIKNIQACTGINVSEHIMKHIVRCMEEDNDN